MERQLLKHITCTASYSTKLQQQSLQPEPPR